MFKNAVGESVSVLAAIMVIWETLYLAISTFLKSLYPIPHDVIIIIIDIMIFTLTLALMKVVRNDDISSKFSLPSAYMLAFSIISAFIIRVLIFRVQGHFNMSFFAYELSNRLYIIRSLLVTALAEETLFRGYLQTILEREYRPIIAILLSSAFFTTYHINFNALEEYLTIRTPWLCSIFLFSIFIGYLYRLSNGRLFVPILFHGIYNFSASFLRIKVEPGFLFWMSFIGYSLVWVPFIAGVIIVDRFLSKRKTITVSEIRKSVQKLANSIVFPTCSALFSTYLFIRYFSYTVVLAFSPPRRIEKCFLPIANFFAIFYLFVTIYQLMKLSTHYLKKRNSLIRWGLFLWMISLISPEFILLKTGHGVSTLPSIIRLIEQGNSFLITLSVLPAVVLFVWRFMKSHGDRLLMACGMSEIYYLFLVGTDYFDFSLKIVPSIFRLFSGYLFLRASKISRRNISYCLMILLFSLAVFVILNVPLNTILFILPYLSLSIYVPISIAVTILAAIPHKS